VNGSESGHAHLSYGLNQLRTVEQNVQTSGHDLLTSDCNFKTDCKARVLDNVLIKIRNTRMSVNATTFTQKRHAGTINLARNVWMQVRWLSSPSAQRYRHKHAQVAIQAHTHTHKPTKTQTG